MNEKLSSEHAVAFLHTPLNFGAYSRDFPLFIFGLNRLQQMTGLLDQVNTIEIRLSDPYQATSVKNDLQKQLPKHLEIISWSEQEAGSYKFLILSNWMRYFILLALLPLVYFTLKSMLILMILGNRRKIAILSALGLTNETLYNTFRVATLIIAIIGISIGGVIGYSGHYLILYFLADTLRELGILHPTFLITVPQFFFVISTVCAIFMWTVFDAIRTLQKMSVIDILTTD